MTGNTGYTGNRRSTGSIGGYGSTGYTEARASAEKLREVVVNRIHYLERILMEKSQAVNIEPTGHLKGTLRGSSWQYCYRESYTGGSWKYIKKSEEAFAAHVAQGSYDRKVIVQAEKELKALNKLFQVLTDGSVEQTYPRLPKSFQNIVHPIIEPPEKLLRRWKSETFQHKSFLDGEPEYYSQLHERMRSKSEVLIADMLTRCHIPYIYEKPLKLSGFGFIYPDFTLMDFQRQQEIYWEHMGLLDDKSYRDTTILKLDCYMRNGIFPGDRLIITAETARRPLNMKLIELQLAQLPMCIFPG